MEPNLRLSLPKELYQKSSKIRNIKGSFYLKNLEESLRNSILLNINEGYRIERSLKDKDKERVIIEIYSQSICHHSLFIRQLSGFEFTNNFIGFIYTKKEDHEISLKTIFDNQTFQLMTGTQKTIISIGLACAMFHIHYMGVIHGKINPSSIFLDSNPATSKSEKIAQISLEDFRLARPYNLLYDEDLFQQIEDINEAYYASPEVIANVNNISTKSDIYSFGIILYSLLVGTEKTTYPLLQFPPSTPKDLVNLIRICTAQNPKDRFSSWKILSMLFNQYGWFPDTNPHLIKKYRTLIYENSPIYFELKNAGVWKYIQIGSD